jgi:ABC-type multidrug transport system ATPase subunit
MTSTRPAPLEADSVCHSFGNRRVLTSASLRAVQGQVTGLLGRNGAGKTTLLRILVGMQVPDNGAVRLDGAGQMRVTLSRLAARGVFFLPARDLLLSGLSVRDQLCSMRDTFAAAVDVHAVATSLGIADRLDQKPPTLSGGERRRAEVAAALARAPTVLVADEPLRGITPVDAEVLMGALRAFAARGGAVVITGHELPLLLPHLDRVTWCHAGRTREFPSVEAATADFAFRRDFLPLS